MGGGVGADLVAEFLEVLPCITAEGLESLAVPGRGGGDGVDLGVGLGGVGVDLGRVECDVAVGLGGVDGDGGGVGGDGRGVGVDLAVGGLEAVQYLGAEGLELSAVLLRLACFGEVFVAVGAYFGAEGLEFFAVLLAALPYFGAEFVD